MVKLEHEDADKTVYSFRGPKSHRRVEIIIKNKDYFTNYKSYWRGEWQGYDGLLSPATKKVFKALFP